MDFKARHNFYSQYLKNDILPFWMQHSLDEEDGGYYTCLDREGKVFDSDKFVWLQNRQIWTFSMFYNQLEQNPQFLQIAEHGAAFMEKHGRNEAGDWYFSLDKKGQPLTQAYNIFSDCFACMAFAQLSKASGNQAYAELAVNTFKRILERKDNPKGIYNKATGNRPLKGFSLPMILCNLVLEIEHLLSPEEVEATLKYGVNEVMNVFYKAELGLIVENVKADGSIDDSSDGRVINPGHGLESMWFLMDIAEKWNDSALIEQCVQISLQLMDYGWDKEHGGIFYFLDRKNSPPFQLEWDQKLWWVHLEACIAMLKGYQLTGNKQCLAWYEKLHDYIWEHFVDSEFGEMYGYLNRQGEVLINLKGGKWKGCFHVPRAIFQLANLSNKIAQAEELKIN